MKEASSHKVKGLLYSCLLIVCLPPEVGCLISIWKPSIHWSTLPNLKSMHSDCQENSLPILGLFCTAGAPNVTELTLDRESRTLTCTSTGGPATTVTWTKDGAVITPSTTHQQTQMIVDTVGGIYQNTLTIAQSVTGDNLYGLYSCMVENSRGSSNRTVYFYGKSFIIG